MVKQYIIPIITGGLISSSCMAAELELAVGINLYKLTVDHHNPEQEFREESAAAPRFSVRIHAPHGKTGRHFWGTGLDITQIDSQQLLGFRALDYQWQATDTMRLGGFIGAASLDNSAAQMGYYLGANISWPSLYNGLGISLETTLAHGLGRDRLGSDTPPAPEAIPDIFFNSVSISANLSWTF